MIGRRLLLVVAAVLFAAPLGAQLVPRDAEWSYLDTGVAPAPNWASLAFDDSGWATGPGPLGYGDGDEATDVSYGSDPDDKHITTWFRHEFLVANPAALPYLSFGLVRDDGAVVYLNGVEILRENLPTGAIDDQTLATEKQGGAGENATRWMEFDPQLLRAGMNVLAVEVHLEAPDSNDLSFELVLSELAEDQVVRGPYVQLPAPDAVTLRWRTTRAVPSRVEYGDHWTALTQVLEDPTPKTDHSVRLTGLAPDQLVYYAVGDDLERFRGGDSLHALRSAPSPGSSRRFRAWMLGDCGNGESGQRRVRDAFLGWSFPTPIDLVLLAGDNAYTDGTDDDHQKALFETYSETLLSAAAFPAIGNHELDPDAYAAIFDLPAAGELGGLASGTESYYSFDWANVHFVVLDSMDSDRSVGGPMLTWLENDLASTSQTWIVAFWHHPPYSAGSHPSDDPQDSGGRLFDMRENALPILEDHGVDLVLTGHSHSYERSYLIDGHYDVSSTFDPGTMLVDGGDGQEAGDGAYGKAPGGRQGAVYVVAGSSAFKTGGDLDHVVMHASYDVLGSVAIDVEGGRLDLVMIDDTGAALDSFTILKDEAGPELEVFNLIAGQDATVRVSGLGAGNETLIGFSRIGPGPTSTPFGDVALSSPFRRLGPIVADAQGLVMIQIPIPPSATGTPIWAQALELLPGGGGLLTNPLALTIQ